MYDLMQKWFWEDYTSDSDGIYSAITQIRTQSKEGNSMLYAATAVEALRAHGIPARYAEGYYISEQALADSEDGNVSVLGEDAQGWTEVYFDGIGGFRWM